MEMMPKPLAEQISVIYRPHPILPAANCERKQQAWRAGQTVREILLANGVDAHQPIIVIVDDRLLTVPEWDTVCPEPGQIINVKAQTADGGGGGDSNPLQVVAMIALIAVVVALQQYELIPAITTWQGAAIAATIMIGGSMVINAVFAAQVPAMSMADTNGQYSQASPTYSLSGGQNRTRPYEAMAVVMGTHRHVPDNGAKPFTEYHGEDQYLYQLFHLGLSTCDRSDWKIGTNPISNYQDYSWAYPDAQGRIGGFPGNVDSTPGSTLEAAAGWITRTTSANTYRIGIDIEGTLYYANNGGGLDATSVQLRVQYRPVGTLNWVDPAFISCSASGFAAGSYQPYYVKIMRFRRWFSGDHTETTEISKAEYDSARSGELSFYDEEGNVAYISVYNYEQRWRFVAGAGGTVIVNGNSQAPRRATLFIDVPTGAYDVRVIRDTGDSTDARLQNKTSWSTLRSYQADTASYIGQNKIGIAIRASQQLNGTVSQLSYLAEAYASYWNGSAWVWGKTSNPAHWYMQFARGFFDSNGRLLWGVGLTDDQIDLDGLYYWGQFCAREGLTFNAVLDRNYTAQDILTAIARCGFGSSSWPSGKLGVIWDERNAPISDYFGMSNIIKGSFEVTYITELLAEEIIVQFINPAKEWQQDEVRALVPGVGAPARSSTITLFGCTNQAMAGKFANYMAAQQYYRKRRIKWDADFQGLSCTRGDVVLLSHDLTQWGYSGRIVSVSGNTVTLDRAVPRSGAVDYILIRRPDGEMTTFQVTAETGDHDTLTLTSEPQFQPGELPIDHTWSFSPLPTPGKRVKIVSVTPQSPTRVQIVATDEDPEFYAAWDGAWTAPVNKSLLAPSTPVISDLKISERLTVIGAGQIVTRITFSWQQHTSQIERVELQFRIAGGQWQTKSVFSGQSTDVDFDGYGTVEVSALPINGIFVGKTISATGAVYGKTLPPEDVQGFTTDPLASRFTLRWVPVSDIDLAGYQIRWINGDSRDWGQAAPIHEGLIVSSPYISASRPAGRGTLMIKAVDTSGNVSITPAAIVLDLGDPVVDNVILSVDIADRGFDGLLTNCTVASGSIKADEQGTMWNPNDSASMWHLASDSMWRAATYYAMTYEFTVDSPAHSAGSNLTLPAVINGDSWTIQYRRLGAVDMWTVDAELMWHGSTESMWTAPPPYMPWPGSITANEGTYQFKIDISFGANRGEISALAASFDVPDIKETLPEVAISASGTRLPITKDYYAIKGVNLTLLAGTGNAFSAKVIDKDPDLGPLVMCYDLSGNPVSGLVDAEPYGY